MKMVDRVRRDVAARPRTALRHLLPRGFKTPWRRATPKPAVSLALQGGGSFGAFTWGLLDRLLEREDVAIDMVSGVSAGAVNAVLLADGLAEGGPEVARQRLERFWRRVSRAAPLTRLGHAVAGTAALALEFSTRLLSPYQFNPLGLNPLRDMLAEEVDFARAAPGLADPAADRRHRGEGRKAAPLPYRGDHARGALASACLPQLQHAVEIEGEWYWDGGFSANPPLRQLVLDTTADDVVLVQITPEAQKGVPYLLRDITRRMNQITFNGPLQREMEALADLTPKPAAASAISRSRLCRKLQRLRLHRIAAEDVVEGLQQASAMAVGWPFLQRLKDGGRKAAEEWMPRLAREQA